LQEANLWAEKSEWLYALSHKFNIELARKNHYVSGYHWWLFQDYWTTSNGIVDHYFRPKTITTDEVLRINNEVVLLQDGLDRTYRAGTRLDLSLVVSNYSAEPLVGNVVWEVRLGSRSLAADELPGTQVGQGEVTEVAGMGCVLPDVSSPEKVTISASFSNGRECFRNDWSTWLYPAAIRPGRISRPVFADAEQLSRHPDWGLKPIPDQGLLNADASYLVSRLDVRILDAMERGAGVALLGGDCLPLTQYKVTYQSSWWKAGDSPKANHCGTFVYDHPVTRATAPDGWCDDGWYFLVQGGIKFNFGNAPVGPNIIVRALPSMVLVEMYALLFEVCVGKGVLAVSGFNHSLANGRPENDWLIASLLNHLNRGPKPKSIWPASFFGRKETICG
jgi:hypothetical protein